MADDAAGGGMGSAKVLNRYKLFTSYERIP